MRHDWGWRHGGLRRRLAMAFAGVALGAVLLTAILTFSAAVRAGSRIIAYVVEQPLPFMDRLPNTVRFELGRDWSNASPEVRAITRDFTSSAVLAGLLAFLLAGVASAFVTRRLTAPLRALAEGVRRFELGERGLRLALPSSRDELGALTEAFNNLVTSLGRQEAWRRQIVADIVHDLRTPLAVLRSEIEAMQDGVSSRDDHTLDRLHDEVMLLSRLVSDLRTLSLAESGGLALKMSPFPLEPLLARTLVAFSAQASARAVSFSLDVVPGLFVCADEDQLSRVLRNLIDNALRYGLSETPGLSVTNRIELEAHSVTDRAEPLVCITVRDHGPGLPDEALERVFERFYRGDMARTRDVAGARGSGLGLAIARALIEAMGGRLEAGNHPGGGAIFTLFLPTRASNDTT